MSPDAERPPPPATSLSESPWLWLLVFSLAAFAALQLAGRKYGPRQAQLERQHQAREHVLSARGSEGPPAERPEPVYSTPEQTLIGLGPLKVVALAAAAVAALALAFRHARPADAARSDR